MKSNQNTIIDLFRTAMKKHGLDAFIVPSSDPHLSEYPANHWKAREWISGFNGSFGTVIITQDNGALFTDSRYFLQAAAQLEGSGIELVKMGLPDSPSLPEWLCRNLHEGANVGVDAWVYSAGELMSLQQSLSVRGISVQCDATLIDETWTDRPAIPQDPCFVLPEHFSGKSVSAKVAEIQHILLSQKADYLLLSALDEIAWLFNIRGTDVAYNPITIAYAIVPCKGEAILFIQPEKVTDEVRTALEQEHVTLAEYGKIESFLQKLPDSAAVMLDPAKTNYALYGAIPATCRQICGVSPANELKALKNETELEGYRRAMVKDGVALVRFFRWLEQNVETEIVTECTVGEKLKAFRSEQDCFVGESFGTIAGYNDHGAIVHYSPTAESAYRLKKEGVLLIDSGAQYFDGTTDITRTIALGVPTEAQKRDFTLVLKGNIGLASAVFPQNTRGSQIDVMARMPMWKDGVNYLHGTGHGVGHFLNVHEGPQSIRMEENPVTLKPGMVMSDEPGIYREGAYGIRTENMVLIKEKASTAFGLFYQFETLTLCYIDKTLIEKSMLSDDEITWLNNYHQTVYEKLSPYLDEEEKAWLEAKTSAL